MSNLNDSEIKTGALFGNLFTAYDDQSFLQSVELFVQRFRDNKFDVSWFQNKRCLDAGCGGGRYSIALQKLGAQSVVGVDITHEGIEDARRRAASLDCENIEFREASVEALPFADDSFDCVIFSGVLMHTKEPVEVIREMHRVLRKNGMLYALVYATEGLRWPLVQMLRPLAQSIGFQQMDAAVVDAGLPVNRRRTYLDDLFVPYIDYYSWQSLHGILNNACFSSVERWTAGRLDHEENLTAYVHDLRGFFEVFDAVLNRLKRTSDPHVELAQHAIQLVLSVIAYAESVEQQTVKGVFDTNEGRRLAIGQGHHRFIAWKK